MRSSAHGTGHTFGPATALTRARASGFSPEDAVPQAATHLQALFSSRPYASETLQLGVRSRHRGACVRGAVSGEV